MRGLESSGLAAYRWCWFALGAPQPRAGRPCAGADRDRAGREEPGNTPSHAASLEKRAKGKASARRRRIDVQWRRKTG